MAGLAVCCCCAPAAALAAKDDTVFVSRGSGANGTAANQSSYNPVVSGDGRFVAFESGGDALSADDNDLFFNDYVRDVVAGSTTLVSRLTGATGAAPDSFSNDVSISANGRYVASVSSGAFTNVYVRDRQAGTTTLASRATGAAGAAGDGDSDLPAMSTDGRFVAFESDADNLSTEDNNAYRNVFVRDLQAQTTRLVSRAAGAAGAAADMGSGYAAISADGRYVAFDSRANNLSAADVDVSADVFVRDLQASTTTLVSRVSGANGAGGLDDSSAPAISADGRFVVFQSNADNLSTADDNAYTNIFERDVLGPGVAPPPVFDTTAPRLSGLSLSHRRFRVGRPPKGTTFRYTLSEKADVLIAIDRATAGLRLKSRGRCLAATPSNKRKLKRQHLGRRALKRRRCTRYRRSGSIAKRAQPAGAVETAFSGRIGRKALKAGVFRATLAAIDAAGNRSRPARIRFEVSKPRRKG